MSSKKDDFSYQETTQHPYAEVTVKGEDRRSFQTKNIWELKIDQFIKSINPKDYFRTTGEAVLKLRRLEADLFAAAGQARKLGNILEKLKGDNVYLETSWEDGRLLLKAKNPRKNRESKIKALKENFKTAKAKARLDARK